MRTPMSLWFERLESKCWDVYGLGIHGLPKFNWAECYRDGLSVDETIASFADMYPTYTRMYATKEVV